MYKQVGMVVRLRDDELNKEKSNDQHKYRWSLRLFYSSMAVSAAYMFYMVGNMTADSTRLYWEYAGRILSRSHTEGFVEWVQMRTGNFLPIEMAVRISEPLAPYTEFSSEYPAGILLIFSATRFFAEDPGNFARLFGLQMAICMIACSALSLATLVRFGASRYSLVLAAIILGLWPFLTGSFAVSRFDPLATFAAALGVFLAVRGRWSGSGLVLGLGASIKIWPGVLVPFIALVIFRRDRAAAFNFCGLSLMGFLLPHLAMILIGTHPYDMFAYLTYMQDRPLQIESLLANLAMVSAIVRDVEIHSFFSFGSHNIISDEGIWVFASKYSGPALLLSFIIWHSIYSRDKMISAIFLGAGSVGVLVLTSKVFSGEYLIWFLPFVIISMAFRWGSVIAFSYLSAIISLRVIYASYQRFHEVLPVDIVLISLGKNVLVGVVTTVFLVIAARQYHLSIPLKARMGH